MTGYPFDYDHDWCEETQTSTTYAVLRTRQDMLAYWREQPDVGMIRTGEAAELFDKTMKMFLSFDPRTQAEMMQHCSAQAIAGLRQNVSKKAHVAKAAKRGDALPDAVMAAYKASGAPNPTAFFKLLKKRDGMTEINGRTVPIASVRTSLYKALRVQKSDADYTRFLSRVFTEEMQVKDLKKQ